MRERERQTEKHAQAAWLTIKAKIVVTYNFWFYYFFRLSPLSQLAIKNQKRGDPQRNQSDRHSPKNCRQGTLDTGHKEPVAVTLGGCPAVDVNRLT